MKTIALVGNAPSTVDVSDTIDRCDMVVRFNEPSGYGGNTGQKCDIWCLINSGKAPKRWLAGDYSSEFDALLGRKPDIVFPLHPSILKDYHPKPGFLQRLRGHRLDWSLRLSDEFGGIHKPVTLDRDTYESACKVLQIEGDDRKKLFPSSGFLIATWLKNNYPEATLNLFGFTFSGWKRHNWEAERNVMANRYGCRIPSQHDAQ